MSREIKFRAWDTVGNEMLPNVQNHICDPVWAFGHMIKNDRFKIMQYTGLKDKNGKEVFEGDKVRCYNSLFEVKFFDYRGGFSLVEIGGSPYNDEYMINNVQHGEVVGNIYENPEPLLGKTNG